MICIHKTIKISRFLFPDLFTRGIVEKYIDLSLQRPTSSVKRSIESRTRDVASQAILESDKDI